MEEFDPGTCKVGADSSFVLHEDHLPTKHEACEGSWQELNCPSE